MGAQFDIDNVGIKLAGIERGDIANGFGRLGFTLWFQGCSIRCKGCQNPNLWNPDGGELYFVKEIRHQILREIHWLKECGVVVFLGGEPTDQLVGLKALNSAARGYGIPTVLYTGRTEEELDAMGIHLTDFDIVKVGRYIDGVEKGKHLASWNQKIYREGILDAD